MKSIEPKVVYNVVMAEKNFTAYKFYLFKQEYLQFKELLWNTEQKTVSQWLREEFKRYIKKNKQRDESN